MMNKCVSFIPSNDATLAAPDFIKAAECEHITPALDKPDLTTYLARLEQIATPPDVVLFDERCPTLLLVAALQHWKNAQFLIAQPQSLPPAWQDMASGKVYPLSAPAQPSQIQVVTKSSVITEKAIPENPQPKSHVLESHTLKSHAENDSSSSSTVPSVITTVDKSESKSASPTVRPSAQKPSDFTEEDSRQLLRDIFKYSSWDPSQEHTDKINQLLYIANKHNKQYPELAQHASQCKEQGEHAQKLAVEMLQKYKQLGETAEFHQWFERFITDESDPRVGNYLKRKLEKQQRFNANKRINRQNKYSCQVKSPVIDRQHPHHPNSLRHLTPHNHWDIFIDESGNQFDSLEAADSNDKNIGRIVALAVPKGQANLPPLPQNFHATTASNQSLDTAINDLLSQPVGILGLTVKDELAYASPRWLSEVINLVKLVMRLLPLKSIQQSSDKNEVHILIENRGAFTPKMDLNIIQQLIMTELQSIDPERYKQLLLELKFVPKDYTPILAYADVVAHTWGGSSAKLRLKQSKLLGYCLLTPNAEAIERLYARLDDKLPLKPQDWYKIIGQIAQEPEHSLLNDALETLGQNARKDSKLWQSYLHEVQYRLNNKDYTPWVLNSALLWLDRYRPTEQKFTPRLKLQWLMARLVTDNHMGRVNFEYLPEILTLAPQLQDEIAPEVAQAYIRLAVTATNNFEFDNTLALLQYAEQPVAVMGRLNYAKRLSSLGQYYSFIKNYAQADIEFTNALHEFSQLSDQTERADNQQQTRIYQLLNAIDGDLLTGEQLKTQITAHFGKSLEKIPSQLNTDIQPQRFNHHLFLRAMVAYPTEFAPEIAAYLAIEPQWQHGDGHPWNLIEFWRGWLILRHSTLPSARRSAQDYFELSVVDIDADDDITLGWIRLVFAEVIQALGMTLNGDWQTRKTELKRQLPFAPHETLEQMIKQPKPLPNDELLQFINDALPFNFK